MGHYELSYCYNSISEMVQIVRDAIEGSADEPNHRRQVLKLELRGPNFAAPYIVILLKWAVRELESIVGSGNVLVVEDD